MLISIRCRFIVFFIYMMYLLNIYTVIVIAKVNMLLIFVNNCKNIEKRIFSNTKYIKINNTSNYSMINKLCHVVHQ